MITVIVPVYNVEKYLSKCIESIINQTYSDLEIILIDDGSTDRSGEICDEYQKKDNRIKVIHKKNGGLSDARNWGLNIATGKYIAFLDSDDWIDKDLYKQLYNLINKYNSDIAICNFKNAYSEDIELIYSDKEEVYSNVQALEKIYSEQYLQMIVAWNKLYRAEIIKDKRYPVGKIHEDEFLTPILLERANKIVYTNSELIYYRQTPNSIMNSKFNIKRLDYLYSVDNRIKLFKEKKLDYLYSKALGEKVTAIINFYYKTKKSDLEEKSLIIEKLNNTLDEIKYKELRGKDKIKVKLFRYLPKVYEKILLLKLKIKKVK